MNWTEFLQDLAFTFSPWPIIVLFLLLFLLLFRGTVRRIREILEVVLHFLGVSPLRSVKIFGAEVVLSEQGARQVSENVEETFITYRRKLKREYDRQARIHDVRRKLKKVLEAGEVKDVLDKVKGYRSTIHIPDVLFEHTLYQLLDYYPHGGGRGRTWSVRAGMIGRAWRLEESGTEPAVPTEDRELISTWSMTIPEALAARDKRQSFSCIVLRGSDGVPVCILYLDARKKKAFPWTGEAERKFYEAIVRESEESELTEAVVKVSKELKGFGPMINIHD